MACLQLLKSTPSNSQPKFGYFCAEFSLQSRRIRLRNFGIANNYRRFRVSCKIEDGDKQSNAEEPPESLFMKELRRRGMTPTSLLEEKNRSVDRDEEIKFREEDGGWSYSRRNGTTTGAETNLTDQRAKSMALNSEGLEGLIPRAKLLLTLGGTFFLAFWPLILVTVTCFTALYLYFGAEFVHDGSTKPVSPPQYVDPYELLEEERIYKAAPPLN
ncbi:tubulin alpha-6 chain [Perilla frutescens var. hirtella]|uniref:Tubulin alpha-6 chain n=1 Tax=Perilla frutescens var. hirtella TaxID=608512 RepID=A0AAD4JHH1_PERFH|nr:tubulin alpha-6 chain [Perilla frutescens var. frutescens]KAH6793510.1 tubulin alpha-6 chain [Perilla frutescens var. hirtella]KAH6833208.1 tubulin alpha-6 chain [Perilla frutescens var. hirtella]